MIRSVRGFTPHIGDRCYIAETAVLIGDVHLGEACSVWYHAVIRGDVNSIHIGHRVNIQDLCMLHTTYKTTTIHIGNDVSIGHRAIIHGADIADEVLIGMGAVIMDHVKIGRHAIIAAGAVVREGTVVPPRALYAGIPARMAGKVSDAQVKNIILHTAKNYVMYAGWYLASEG